MTQKYFAHEDAAGLVKELKSFTDKWNNVLGSGAQGISGVWARNLRSYYSGVISGTGDESGLEYVGEEGELVKMLVPQARALNQEFLSIATKQKLSFDPLAESTDAETLDSTRLCSGLIQQIIRDQKLDMKAFKKAEMATITGFGYLHNQWNWLKGKPIGVNPDGDLIYSGNLDIQNVLPTDVIFDTTKEDFYDMDWVIVRVVVNKYDLIRKYPRLQTEILALPSVNAAVDNMMFFDQQFNDDYVYQYYFYHRSTPALEDGRYSVYSDENTVYYDKLDNPYKYDDGEGPRAYIPVVQMKPEPLAGCGFGYPKFSNILPIQEMMDFCFSAISSNNAANAVQSITNPMGNDISVKNIGGLRFINYNPKNVQGGGKPEAMQLTASSPETYKFIDILLNHMQMVYQVNSAMRGNPPPGVTSGTALATLTTNGIEFAQNFIKAYIDSMETVMTHAIWAYKNFATQEMLVNMVGPNKTTLVKKFKGEDLSPIRRIIARIGNPLMATAAGRLEVGNQLLQQQMIPDAQGYFDVLEGAPEGILYQDIVDERSLINKENEDLRIFKPVLALIDDSHDLHIQHHRTLTFDPEIRRNSPSLKGILDHIAEHKRLKMEQEMGAGVPAQPGSEGIVPDPMGGVEPLMPSEPQPAEPAEAPVDASAIPLQGPSALTGV